MKGMRSKIASIVLLVTFTTTSLCYGLTGSYLTNSDKLAAFSAFQGYPEEFQAVCRDVSLAGSVLDIADYLLGRADEQVTPLDPEHMAAVISNEMRGHLAGINPSDIKPRTNEIIIPYNRDDRQYVIYVCPAGTAPAALRGLGVNWAISPNRYSVTVFAGTAREFEILKSADLSGQGQFQAYTAEEAAIVLKRLSRRIGSIDRDELERALAVFASYLRHLKNWLASNGINLEQYASIQKVVEGLRKDWELMRDNPTGGIKQTKVARKLKGELYDVVDDADRVILKTEGGNNPPLRPQAQDLKRVRVYS
ncbi:MAG: hypothetical protein ABH885_01495 [Candidatus Omnitrophota bacterium]